MKRLFVVFLLLLPLSACTDEEKQAAATAGSVQDSTVTKGKREADRERNLYEEQVVKPTPTPTPVVMRDVYLVSLPAAEYMAEGEPKLPKRPGASGR